MEAVEHAAPNFPLRQRLLLRLISFAGIVAIRIIGPTIRFQTICEEGGPPASDPLHVPAVYAFWHQCVFASAWFWRHRPIAVMTSRSFDGEYIARIIQHFGFRAVRGSSSRGAVGALLGMHAEVEAGRVAAFTIDGPRGPRFVAKPGPVLLARNTQTPLVVFHVALERKWVLNTWDAMQIPRPFSRGIVYVSRMMTVPASANDAQMEAAHAAMQSALERVRDAAEAMFARQV